MLTYFMNPSRLSTLDEDAVDFDAGGSSAVRSRPHAEQLQRQEPGQEPPRCSICGYTYSCATCVLYAVAARWAWSSSSSSPSSSRPPSPSPPGSSARPSTLEPHPLRPSSPHPPNLDLCTIPPLTVTCVICEVPISWTPSSAPRQPTEQCTHAERACRECLERFVGYMLEEYRTIWCPVVGCGESMKYDDLRAFADKEMFKRYDLLLLRRALSTEPLFIWCKNPSCANGQFHTGTGDCTLVSCPSCESRACSKHDVPWHEGLTCAEYDRAQGKWLGAAASRDRKVKRWIRARAKRCPGCGSNIEKSDGCDHMTCRPPAGCGHQFCWRCGADYANIFVVGNSGHKKSCKHYRPTRGRTWKFWRRDRGMINV